MNRSFPDPGSHISLVTTLNQGSSVGALDTEINLTDASNFPTRGAVQIDNEILFYTGKSDNTLVGCARGRESTNATPHIDGAVVFLKPRGNQGSRVLRNDRQPAGWYKDRSVSNRALKVGNTNLMVPGVLRYNPTTVPPSFQGFNGNTWVNFNAVKGERGERGLDAVDQVNFVNLPEGEDNEGEIYLGSEGSDIQLRSLRSGSFELNPNRGHQPTMNISRTHNYLTLKPNPQPYIWDFTTKNSIADLKSSIADPKFSAYGTIMRFNIRAGKEVSKGMCVRLTLSDSKPNYPNALTYLEIEPYKYDSVVQETKEGSAFLGIALESKEGGEPCEVCVEGITSIVIGDGGGGGTEPSAVIDGPGAYGFVGFNGNVYNESSPTGVNLNTPVAGYWLERGNFEYGDIVLFHVKGNFTFT